MIRRYQTLMRLIGIQRVLVRYGLDDIILATHFLRPLRFAFYVLPKSTRRDDPLGVRVRLALIELGPIFVKFGQAISTRRDLLPPEIADELAKLQDKVPPFPADEAIARLESAYGKSVDEVFSRFDREPLRQRSPRVPCPGFATARARLSGAEVCRGVWRSWVGEGVA